MDLIFPVRCLACGRAEKTRSTGKVPVLCPICWSKIKLLKTFRCLFCGFSSQRGRTCPLCRSAAALDYFWAAAPYQQPLIEKTIRTFKYRLVKSLALPLGRLLSVFLRKRGLGAWLKNHRDSLLVIPLPLHPRRLRWRSFNQAELLAQEVAKSFHLPVEDRVLERRRYSPPQAEILLPQKRRENVRKVFICRRSKILRDKTILLVDDVATTGSTLNEAARALKKAGATTVVGLVIAKG